MRTALNEKFDEGDKNKLLGKSVLCPFAKRVIEKRQILDCSKGKM